MKTLVRIFSRESRQHAPSGFESPQKTDMSSNDRLLPPILVTREHEDSFLKRLRGLINKWRRDRQRLQPASTRDRLFGFVSRLGHSRSHSADQSHQPSSHASQASSSEVTDLSDTARLEAELADDSILRILHIALDINHNHRAMHWKLVDVFDKYFPDAEVERVLAAEDALEWLEGTRSAAAVIVSGSGIATEHSPWNILVDALRDFAHSGGIVFFRDLDATVMKSEFLQHVFGLEWKVTNQVGQYIQRRATIQGHWNDQISFRRNVENLPRQFSFQEEPPTTPFVEDGTFVFNKAFTSAPPRAYDKEATDRTTTSTPTSYPAPLEDLDARRKFAARISARVEQSRFRNELSRFWPTTLVNVSSSQQLYRAKVRADDGGGGGGAFVVDREIPTLVAMTRYRQRGWICFLGFGPGSDKQLKLEARTVVQLVRIFDPDRRVVVDAAGGDGTLRRSYSRF